MLIDRSLPNITTTWIGYRECTKPLEECWEEKYSDSDFFYEISIEMIHTHRSCIKSESISLEFYYYIQGSDYIKKCHHVTDTGDIMEGEFFKKKPTGNERESCIFGSRYFDFARERLWSVEREHTFEFRTKDEKLKISETEMHNCLNIFCCIL